MGKKYVRFVTDKQFEDCVRLVCDTYNEGIILEDQKLQKTGIDPIKMTFDMMCENKNFRKWKIKETARKKDKTVNNAIGNFHQKLLGHVKGWTDLGTNGELGLDLKKNDNSVLMELKNKDNDLNSNVSKEIRNKLMKAHKKYPKARCYFAYISAANCKSEEKHWTPKSKKLPQHKKIRRISGSKVYELVTGKSDALEQVWRALPSAIKNVCKKENPLTGKKEIEEFEKWFKLAYSKPEKPRKKKS